MILKSTIRTVLLGGILTASNHAGIPVPQTQSLLDAKPGLRALFDGDRMIALYGVPFAESPNPSSDPQVADEFVDEWLANNADVLGLPGLTVAFASRVNVRDGAFAIYTYVQTVEGLPVLGSAIKIRVMRGTVDKIGYSSMRLVPLPSGPLPTDLFTEIDAIAVVDENPQYDSLNGFTTPAKVVVQSSGEVLHRAWRFIGYSVGASIEFLVDTHEGQILSAQDRRLYADVAGKVTGWATPGTLPDIPPTGPLSPAVNSNEVVNTPAFVDGIPFVLVSIPGHGSQYTDATGGYRFEGLSSGESVVVTSALAGLRAIIHNVAQPPNSSDLTCSSAFVSAPAEGVELTYNPPPHSYPDSLFQTAQLNAFLTIEKTYDFFQQSIEPDFPQIDQQLPCDVNAVDNSHYEPPSNPSDPGLLNMSGHSYGQPAVRNGAFSTAVSHEYAHFVHNKIENLAHHRPITWDGYMREGVADTLSAFVWDTPRVFEGGAPGGPGRDLESSDVKYGCDACVPLIDHCCGLAIAGAFWDMRSEMVGDLGESAKAEAARILAEFMIATNGEWNQMLVPLDVLMADDNDMIIENGTPNQARIEAGFTAHGWVVPYDYGGAQTVVRWNAPGLPAAPVDYELNNQVFPPNVRLKSTLSGSFEVNEWRIGRVSGSGVALDLGTIDALWSGDADVDVAVRVGVDAEAPCRTVNTVDIVAHQSGVTWSNIELQLSGDVRTRVKCSANSGGEGGRVSGTIAGDCTRIFAHSIGRGASDAGQLTVGGRLNQVAQLQTLSPAATFDFGSISNGSVTVLGDVSGTIRTGSLIGSILDVRGNTAGILSIGSATASATRDSTIKVRELSGTIELTDARVPLAGAIEVGTPTVPADIAAGGRISAPAALAGSARLTVFGHIEGGGLIQLTGGMSAGSEVDIHGNLDGTIEVLGVSNELSGTIEIGESGAPANITHTGLLTIESQITGPETLVVNGNVDSGGRVQLKNGVADGGSIRIAGDLGGTLEIGAPVVFGGTLAGGVNVDGAVSGTISHYGLATSTGTIDLGSVASTGRYTQTLTDPTGPWAGSLAVHDDMGGTVQFSTVLQGAEVTIGGNIPGAASLTIRELYDSIVNLNFHACQVSTSGTVNIGHTTTVWQPDANGTVDMGDIRMFGDFAPTGRINFYGCKRSGVSWQHMSELCFEQHAWGQISNYLCKPKPQIDQCPPTVIEDPCVQ